MRICEACRQPLSRRHRRFCSSLCAGTDKITKEALQRARELFPEATRNRRIPETCGPRCECHKLPESAVLKLANRLEWVAKDEGAWSDEYRKHVHGYRVD